MIIIRRNTIEQTSLPKAPVKLAQNNNICLKNGIGTKNCSINGVNINFQISEIPHCGPKKQRVVLDITNIENTSRTQARVITIFGLDSSGNRVEEFSFQLNPYKKFNQLGEIYLCMPSPSGGVEVN